MQVIGTGSHKTLCVIVPPVFRINILIEYNHRDHGHAEAEFRS